MTQVEKTWKFVELLPLEGLLLDEDFQREKIPSHQSRLATNWDDPAALAIHVAEFAEGSSKYTYSVLDGKQRIGAALERGMTHLPAFVHLNASKARRADLFGKLNYRRGLTAYDRHIARAIAGDDVAVDIAQQLKKNGVTLLRNGNCKGPRDFRAIDACYRIYGRKHGGGAGAVDFSFQAMLGWVGRKSTITIQSYPLQGIATVVGFYRTKADVAAYVQKLKAFTYDEVDMEVGRRAALKGGSNGSGGPSHWEDVFGQIERGEFDLGQELRKTVTDQVTKQRTQRQVAA